jgi:predicted dehydrogenase
MGLNHLRVLSKDKNCEVVAICDANPSLSAVAGNYGRAFYGDVSEMLENETPDAADICVPTTLHEKTAVECLKQGLHVFVEKPIAHDSAAAESMIREAAKRRKVLMVGHVERFNPAVTALKSSLEKDEIISLSFTRVGPTPPRIKDVGVIADLGIHDIDLARYLSGAEVEKVFCASYKRNGTDDCVQMLLRMKGGISAQLTVNWITPYKVRSIEAVTLNKVYAADLLRNEVKAFSNYSLNPNPSCTKIGRAHV